MRNEKRDRGFTLLELVIVVAILAIVSAGGLAALVSYSRIQALSAATYDFVALLNKAKSQARSQVVNDKSGNNLCGTQTFNGYEVRLCLSGSTCNSGPADDATYELNTVCGNVADGNPGTPKIETQKLPNGISFRVSSSRSVRFRSVTGGITNAASITIDSNPAVKFKIIAVDSSGNIQITD